MAREWCYCILPFLDYDQPLSPYPKDSITDPIPENPKEPISDVIPESSEVSISDDFSSESIPISPEIDLPDVVMSKRPGLPEPETEPDSEIDSDDSSTFDYGSYNPVQQKQKDPSLVKVPKEETDNPHWGVDSRLSNQESQSIASESSLEESEDEFTVNDPR